MTRICKACGEEKDIENFYFTNKNRNTRSWKCAKCICKRVSQVRLNDLDNYRKRDQERSKRPERRAYLNASIKRQYDANPEKFKGYHKKWKSEFPNARKAHVITGNALRDKRLFKSSCEECGDNKVNAHHDDYDKPLEVRWLCNKHHAEWHVSNGPGKNRELIINN